MTKSLTMMQRALVLFTLMVLLAVGIPTALGGGTQGPVLHWPGLCPPAC
jgi:hypothetical protein